SSRLEADCQRQLANIIQNAEVLFGRPVEPKQLRLIACLDRQCDMDAFYGRHIPIPVVIPRFSFDRLAIVCQETAAMQLARPQSALRSALALSIVIEQKRGFIAGWVATILTQQ